MKAKIPAELDDAASAEIVRAWLTQLMPDGRSVARVFHESTLTSPEDRPTGSDDIERALTTLALDAYPAFLLPPESSPLPLMENQSIRIVSLLHKHPQQTHFTTAAMQDPVLKKVFQQESEHTGRYSMIYRNTGSGGSVQLVMLPDLILRSAWRHLDAENAIPAQFARQALDELDLLRRAFAGKQSTVTAKLAFTGVLMPPNSRLDIDGGVVRPTTEADRKFAPESLKAQVTGTDSTGSTAVVNYDGDVVLEYEYPYKARVVNEPLGEATPPVWPQDMHPPAALEQAVLRLRFSLMLTVERPERAQLIPTWRYVDDPLSSGIGMSWSDPRQAPGFMPIQLTDADITTWGEWYQRLSTPQIAKIELALSRVLRAIAERREPSDVLIDSVIAWENLFGTREGETTFRVTTCLAVLLEDSYKARASRRKQLADIYALRSKVVHGSANLRVDDYPKCQEALNIAIRAIRILATTRTDILALPDGAARTAALLLGGPGSR